MNKKFGKFHKVSILVVVFLCTLAMLYFGTEKFIKEIKERSSAMVLHIAKQEAREDRLNQMSVFRQQYEKVQSSHETLELTIYEDEKIEIIELVERIAEETGNEISISVPEDEKTVKTKTKSASDTIKVPSGLQSINFELVLIGNYTSSLTFLHKIENMNDFAFVSSIQILRKHIEEVEGEERKNVFIQKRSLDEESTERLVETGSEIIEQDPKVYADDLVESRISVSFFMPIEKKAINEDDSGSAQDTLSKKANVHTKKQESSSGGNNVTISKQLDENND